MRHAVVSGASIAGLSAAFWLHRTGWRVTVLERAEAFRDGGQNVDVRGVAHEVLDRMGLTAAVRDLNTTETGTVMVDESGEVTAELPSDGPDGATAELEILRGDFARCILDVLPDEVEIGYGDSITTVTDRGDAVDLMLESGRALTADLLVVAEGVRSATRGLVFDTDEVDARDIGVTMAFGTIPRTADDDTRWRWFTTVGGRQVHLRPDNHGTTRAILAFAGEETLLDLEPEAAVARLGEVFADAGWQAGRVLDGFASTEDLYLDRLTQIRMPHWSRSRVCLAGDAAWCVTPLGGGGASLALTSGYVLAAYLSTEPDVAAALTSYERWLRPVVDAVQKLPRGIDHLAYPRTRLGLAANRLVTRAMTSTPLAAVASKFTQVADTDQTLPPMAAGSSDVP